MRKTFTYGFTAAIAGVLALAPGTAIAAPTVDVGSPAATTGDGMTPLQKKIDALLPKTGFSPAMQQRIRAAAAKLPARWLETVAATQKHYGLTGTTYFQQSQSVIGSGDTACRSTPLNNWLSTQLRGVNPFRMLMLSILGGDQIPTYDALVFGHQSKDNSFGIDGSYTNELNREMNSLKRFWDVDGSDIQLIPMHGDVYQDLGRITRVYEVVYGLSHDEALGDAQIVQAIVLDEPVLDDGNNPYFTFNAFSFKPTPEDVENLGLTKRIIVGDGILEGMRGIGLKDKAAPLGILAHEYGHQVQYAKGLFDSDLTGAAATRRTELMADAFGSYFVVHARGASLNADRTLDVEKSFYDVGDCNVTSEDHHGTPAQRFKSSSWAVNVAESAPNQGHKLTAMQFDAKFETELPVILKEGAN